MYNLAKKAVSNDRIIVSSAAITGCWLALRYTEWRIRAEKVAKSNLNPSGETSVAYYLQGKRVDFRGKQFTIHMVGFFEESVMPRSVIGFYCTVRVNTCYFCP